MVKVVISALCQQNKQNLFWNIITTTQYNIFLSKSREHQIVLKMMLKYFSTVVQSYGRRGIIKQVSTKMGELILVECGLRK